MNKMELKSALMALNNKLAENDIKGEIAIYGGAVMCLVLDARESTMDIDAIFQPKEDIRPLIKEVAEELYLESDWFNDGVKGFISENNELEVYEEMSHLLIYNASAEYMFAMKALSSRIDNPNEINDIKFLIKLLNIKNIQEAEKIIYKFYPRNRILPKTFYLLEELLEEVK